MIQQNVLYGTKIKNKIYKIQGLNCAFGDKSCPRNQKQKNRPLGWFFLLLNCSTGFEPAKHKRKPDESMAVRQADKHSGTTER